MVLFDNTVPAPVPLVDGADPITTGTPTDESWYGALSAALDKQLHSADDPTKYPSDGLTELKNARDGEATLLAKLQAMEGLFTGVGPASLRNGFRYGNWMPNGDLAMWSRGPAAAPDYFTLSGAGAAVAQCGSGQADTIVAPGQDFYSAKLTYGSAPALLTHNAVSAATAARVADLLARIAPRDGSNVAVTGYASDEPSLWFWAIALVRSLTNGIARISVKDAAKTVYSPYHDGNNTLYTLKPLIAGPLDWTSGAVSYVARVEGAGSGYFQSLGLFASPVGLPPMIEPSSVRIREHTFPIIPTPVAAVGYGYFHPPKPFYALALKADVFGAVPTGGTTLKLDLMTPVGGTFVSLFNSLPAFVASDRHLYKDIDTAAANVRRRTIRGNYAAGGAANLADNSVLRLDVNTRDSGATATNIQATVIGFEYERPFEQFRLSNDLGE